MGRDRMRPSLALDDGTAIQQRRHARAIQRRRHDENTQVVAQALLTIARQRQPQVGVQRPLVEFVEQDRGDTIERGISEDHAVEHTLGDNLDAGARTHLGAKPRPQADGAARRLSKGPRHPIRRPARRDAPRLQHQDFASGEPRRIQQRQWQSRRLSRPRWRDKHGRGARGEGGAHFGQHGIDGKWRRELHCRDVHRRRGGGKWGRVSVADYPRRMIACTAVSSASRNRERSFGVKLGLNVVAVPASRKCVIRLRVASVMPMLLVLNGLPL